MYTSHGFGPQSRTAAWIRSTIDAPGKSVAALTPFDGATVALACATADPHPPKANHKPTVRQMRRGVTKVECWAAGVDISILTK